MKPLLGLIPENTKEAQQLLDQFILSTLVGFWKMTREELALKEDQTTGEPRSPHDPFKKPQIFSFISNKNLANVLVPVSGMFWVGGFIYANENKLSPIEVGFTRYAWQVVTIFAILAVTGEKIDLRNSRDYKLVMARSFISALSSLTAAFFQKYLPLTVFYTINSSVTIFAFLLNYLLFGVAITGRQGRAIGVALVGIVLVINGRAIYQFLDSSYEFTSEFDYSSSELLVQIVMGLVVVVWACIWAYGIVITGKHNATYHELVLINTVLGSYMFGVLQLTLSAPPSAGAVGVFVSQPDKWFQNFLYCGLPINVANYFFLLGMFISENTGVSTMLIQLNIVYVYFISTLRYSEDINYICLLGAALVIGSIYATLFVK